MGEGEKPTPAGPEPAPAPAGPSYEARWGRAIDAVRGRPTRIGEPAEHIVRSVTGMFRDTVVADLSIYGVAEEKVGKIFLDYTERMARADKDLQVGLRDTELKYQAELLRLGNERIALERGLVPPGYKPKPPEGGEPKGGQ